MGEAMHFKLGALIDVEEY